MPYIEELKLAVEELLADYMWFYIHITILQTDIRLDYNKREMCLPIIEKQNVFNYLKQNGLTITQLLPGFYRAAAVW
ncbi:MAG: hypothetical protein NC083_09010 [Muribaculum sp.]|nr:hypothetical protein [Muribaculum sp.]MCM1577085.1 hypothetical protein [Bacteroides sp.]